MRSCNTVRPSTVEAGQVVIQRQKFGGDGGKPYFKRAALRQLISSSEASFSILAANLKPQSTCRFQVFTPPSPATPVTEISEKHSTNFFPTLLSLSIVTPAPPPLVHWTSSWSCRIASSSAPLLFPKSISCPSLKMADDSQVSLVLPFVVLLLVPARNPRHPALIANPTLPGWVAHLLPATQGLLHSPSPRSMCFVFPREAPETSCESKWHSELSLTCVSTAA